MSLQSFLYRETRWVRNNAAALVIVLLILPAMFAGATLAFQQVIPRDTPIAVAPADDTVNQDSLHAIQGVSATFSRPSTFESRDAAMRALAREEVYAVFVVPPDLLDQERSSTIEMIVEEEMVPYEQPSLAIRSLLDRNLHQLIEGVSVTRTTVGEQKTLSEFLLSASALLLTMVYAFVLLPHVVASERSVYRRIRVTGSLGTLLTAKFAVFSALMVVPILGGQAIANHFDLAVNLLHPTAIGITLLTFCYLAAIAVGVMFLFKFSTLGRLVNIALLFGGVVFASMVYPAGFFSPLRRTVAKLLPMHYSMIVQRGVSLKGNGPGLYADYIAALLGVTLLALLFLYGSVRYYEWRA